MTDSAYDPVADLAPEPAGSEGYAANAERFIAVDDAVPFEALYAKLIPLLPPTPAPCLDVGAGAGRDAAAMALRGFDVCAVEPVAALRDWGIARQIPNVTWVNDSLPALAKLPASSAFSVALSQGVWHHLDRRAQRLAMGRIGDLLRPGGLFALSLRHGPAGIGTRVFPCSLEAVHADAFAAGLVPLAVEDNQPSLLPGKTNVTWTRLVLAKGPST